MCPEQHAGDEKYYYGIKCLENIGSEIPDLHRLERFRRRNQIFGKPLVLIMNWLERGIMKEVPRKAVRESALIESFGLNLLPI